MTRSLYGMTPGEVIAAVNADPTSADSTHRDFGPISATVQIWSYGRTTQVTDLMSVNMSTLQPASAISVVTADATLGRTPFFGVDGYSGPYWAKDSSGNWWLMNPSDTASRGSSNLWLMDLWDGTGSQPTRPVGANLKVQWLQPVAPPAGSTYAQPGDLWLTSA